MAIADNIRTILSNIEEARLRSPRSAREVNLLAVSKTKPIEDVIIQNLTVFSSFD